MKQEIVMANNILLIVEGCVDEKNIFGDIFEDYGFKTIISDEILNIDGCGQFDKAQYGLLNNTITIIQGPRNRIHDFLKIYSDKNIDIEKVFSYEYAFFSAIFLIYDVDHNDCDDVETMFKHFNDETRGLLLLSSPCIEVIADYRKDRTEEKYNHIREYKADINAHHCGATRDFVRKNFNSLMLYFLNENFKEFNEPNIMEHPALIVNKINKLNERINCKNPEDSYVIYRYFSTVIYVAVAYANKLTIQQDNFSIVNKFFMSKEMSSK